MGATREVNPLDVLDLRRTSFPPIHFEYMDIPFSYNMEESIIEWIDVNLRNRFYVGKNVRLDRDTNKLVNVLTVGFEDPKELSYFALACPVLKYQ